MIRRSVNVAALSGTVIKQPFSHAILDRAASQESVRKINGEWPEFGWTDHHHKHSKKRGNQSQEFGLETRSVIHALNGPDFLDFISEGFDIEDLCADPSLAGGGLHETFPGGYLDIHADFNVHPETGLIRRLNLLLFLNEDWNPEWGGALELWGDDRCQVSIEPIAGRCVIFETSDKSFHGQPAPLACPPDRSRRSLALYYYSPRRPDETVRPHSTLYRGEEEIWFKTA